MLDGSIVSHTRLNLMCCRFFASDVSSSSFLSFGLNLSSLSRNALEGYILWYFWLLLCESCFFGTLNFIEYSFNLRVGFFHTTWEYLRILDKFVSTWECNGFCEYLRITWELIVLMQLEGICSTWEFNGCCEYLRVTWGLVALIQLKQFFLLESSVHTWENSNVYSIVL